MASLQLPRLSTWAAVLFILVPSAWSTSPRPHVVFMLADDLGWNNVGWRNPELSTPTIDELHSSGVELARMYVYKYCSPTRSSLMSGRLPIHVTQNNKNNLVTNAGGADLRMTLLPERLRAAGYRTAMTGKWHVGARSVANLPISRGFDSHFGFLKGGEDHISQRSSDAGISFVDLWRDHGPAFGENGTFSTYIYAREAVRVIKEHAVKSDSAVSPLFLYLPWHAAHTPLEAPASFVHPVSDDTKGSARSRMNGLVNVLDEGVRNVTAALKSAGMWENTLLIFQADNGGWTANPELGGNNWPLRGGKVSDFEGGVRATAFMNGGFLDRVNPALRGTTNSGLMHVSDWYATLCRLAGVPAYSMADAGAVNTSSVPPLDSIELWNSLSVPGATTSRRTEVPLAFCSPLAGCDSPSNVGDHALIVGNLKVVNGTQGNLGFWQGPRYPNASSAKLLPRHLLGCPHGCLFDIVADPTEQHDIKDASPEMRAKFQQLMHRLTEIGKTVYQTDYSGGYDLCEDGHVALVQHHGFLAPRCSNSSEQVSMVV